jgi:hypothetical protein
MRRPVHRSFPLAVAESRLSTIILGVPQTMRSFSSPFQSFFQEGDAAISVRVPPKNERRKLPILGERLFAVLRQLGRPFEVTVINYGSTDGTLLPFLDWGTA